MQIHAPHVPTPKLLPRQHIVMYWHRGFVNAATISTKRAGKKGTKNIFKTKSNVFCCEYRPRMYSHKMVLLRIEGVCPPQGQIFVSRDAKIHFCSFSYFRNEARNCLLQARKLARLVLKSIRKAQEPNRNRKLKSLE